MVIRKTLLRKRHLNVELLRDKKPVVWESGGDEPGPRQSSKCNQKPQYGMLSFSFNSLWGWSC